MKDKFQIVLILLLILLFIVMSFKSSNGFNSSSVNQDITSIKYKAVVIFHHPNCKSCKKEIEFIEEELKAKYPEITFRIYNIIKSKNEKLMEDYYKEYGLDTSDLATPTTFIGDDYLLGYEGKETSGKRLETLIKRNLLNQKNLHNENNSQAKIAPGTLSYVDTWFGRIDVFQRSLPFLAVTLGLLDGFNPCAMWVLVYLVSLIIGLNDKSKIWLIVGSFVFASGVLYFLFMTALLNVFLYIGYLRYMEILFGCLALYIGITSLKHYLIDKGNMVCKVSGADTKTKVKSKMKSLVESEISLLTILGVIGLAFVVNSMEFVCSAALPAVYTSVLAQADLSSVAYYLYILLYVFFFLLNQLVIFSLAAFTVSEFTPEKYLVHIQLFGGGLLIALGVIMVFFPQYLR